MLNEQCPFCGGRRLIVSVVEESDGEQDKFYGEIYCPTCRITIRSCKKFWTYAEALDTLLTMWNTRRGEK